MAMKVSSHTKMFQLHTFSLIGNKNKIKILINLEQYDNFNKE
jgi:hypothetical protein